MPYQAKSGSRNQLTWFLSDEEINWLYNHNHLKNKELFTEFNRVFKCQMTYSRMRHFQAQYGLQKQERGRPYTAEEKEFVLSNYDRMSCKHMGEALKRTTHSIEKLMNVLKLKRSKESVTILRTLRSKSGAANYHAKIKRGELQHPAQALHDGYIKGLIKKGTEIEYVPPYIIELKRLELRINRELKKIKINNERVATQ